MKAYRVCGCTAPLILDRGAKWMWVVNFMPRPLCRLAKSSGTHRIGSSVCPRVGLAPSEQIQIYSSYR